MAYNYENKVCVVTGAASGMGLAVVNKLIDFGAKEIYALDIKGMKDEDADKPTKFIQIDLGSTDSIAAAVAELPDGIDALFQVAGIPGVTNYDGKGFGPMDVVRINYAGARTFIEACIPKMNEGGAIVAVASIAGANWRKSIEAYKELLAIKDFDEILKYVEARQDDPVFIGGDPKLNKPYVCAKELLNMYCASRSWTLSGQKIRINSIMPGATRTPMYKNFLTIVGKKEDDSMPTSLIGRDSIPEEQAQAMVYLNSDEATYISGQCLAVDYAIDGAMFNGLAGIC